jgi:hypothetical protein
MEITAEAEDGDVEIARLTFQILGNEVTPNEELEPWDVYEEISLWVDGDKIASFEADEENEYLDEDDGTFRFSNLGLILKEDEEVKILVAVTVNRSVDGSDAAADAAEWNIDVLEARVFDADGVAETDDYDEMGADERGTIAGFIAFTAITDGITFKIVEEGVDDDADIESDSNSPVSATLKVEDNTTESDEYIVHIFEIEVDDESSDLLLEDAYVWVEITNPVGGVTSIDSTDVIDEIKLTIGGQTETGDAVVNENTPITDGAMVRVGFLFEFDGLNLEADETYSAEVAMIFEGADIDADPTLSAYDPGTSIKTDVDAQEAGALWQVEGVEDDNVLTGDDDSELHTLNTVVPVITATSFSDSANDAQTAGSVTFQFTVEADGEEDIANFTVANILDTVVGGALDPTPVLVKTGGDATGGAGNFTIEDGDKAQFALTFTFPAGAGNNGTYFVTIDSVLGVEVDEVSDALNINGN